MKKARIKYFLRMPIPYILLMAAGLTICGWFLVGGIQAGTPALIAIGAALLALFIVGEGFYLNYGLTISKKKVTLIYFDAFKVLRYDDIVYIKIIFYKDSVHVVIKANWQKPMDFYFIDWQLEHAPLLSRFCIAKVKLSERFIEKCIKELSAYDKVKVEKREDSPRNLIST